MLDKNIHRDEFRLRILCTNTCNLKCAYCLNDFQPKGQASRYLTEEHARKIISAYTTIENKNPVITFSGGEPGIWGWLLDCSKFAKKKKACVKICTNGLALNEKLDRYVDKWHIHIISPGGLPMWLDASKILIQFVVCKKTTVKEMCSIVEYYGDIPVKFFVDIYEPDKASLYDKIEKVQEKYGQKVTTRFTGVQENRGSICTGCTKDCVTLKGVWVFPEGYVSTCPQGVLPKYHIDIATKELNKFMTYAAWGHNH
jgi:organic radical activating enzyme